MLAIDTNVVVRCLVGDHPSQSAQARALVRNQDVYVSATVLLESEWVLRTIYGFAAPRLPQTLRAFCGLEHVTVDHPLRLAQALDFAEAGGDFADALHIVSAAECEAFVSFDKRLARVAKRNGMIPVRSP